MIREADLFEVFNQIYRTDLEKKGYTVDSMPQIRKVSETLKKYEMPTSLFNENLKTLVIRKSASLDKNVEATYIPKYNRITISDDKYLSHELFHMASSDGSSTTGVSYISNNGQIVGYGLKEGITEMFCALNDPDYETLYPCEKFVAETLCYIYGFNIFKSHFDNDPQGFLLQTGNPTLAKELMLILDKFSHSFENICKSLNVSTKVDENDLYVARFSFEQILETLAYLFHTTKREDKREFVSFIQNGLNKKEMEQVLILMSGSNIKRILSDEINGKLKP